MEIRPADPVRNLLKQYDHYLANSVKFEIYAVKNMLAKIIIKMSVQPAEIKFILR